MPDNLRPGLTALASSVVLLTTNQLNPRRRLTLSSSTSFLPENPVGGGGWMQRHSAKGCSLKDTDTRFTGAALTINPGALKRHSTRGKVDFSRPTLQVTDTERFGSRQTTRNKFDQTLDSEFAHLKELRCAAIILLLFWERTSGSLAVGTAAIWARRWRRRYQSSQCQTPWNYTWRERRESRSQQQERQRLERRRSWCPSVHTRFSCGCAVGASNCHSVDCAERRCRGEEFYP